jgi:hypothetical protein
LVPDGVHDALMTLRRMHEFVRVDALAFPIGVHRPVRFIDKHTRDQWVRSRETATFIRWVCGVEPLSHSTLEARLVEIGIIGKLFESRLKPHPKLILFQLTNELIEETEGLNKESEA